MLSDYHYLTRACIQTGQWCIEDGGSTQGQDPNKDVTAIVLGVILLVFLIVAGLIILRWEPHSICL